ncbi:FkbM family methyltransferase [Persicimonas caeni]|nr:FkbM family methyltransferase [Persicimonas caeni]
MLSQKQRHLLAQRLFWSPLGERLASIASALEVRFDTVIRNFSLMRESNGEKWIVNFVEPRGVVMDVGFFRGEFTQAVLQRQPSARVIAFDPSQAARKFFDAELEGNKRITFESLALSNSEGQATFFDYANECNSLAQRVEQSVKDCAEPYAVEVTTLDRYCERQGIEHINFLKIDAEGFDLHVLEGATEILEQERVDVFMFEFGSGWIASRRYLHEAVELLEDKPYRLFRLFNGFLGNFDYDYRYDSCSTRPAMYVGMSERRLSRGDVPVRDLRLL